MVAVQEVGVCVLLLSLWETCCSFFWSTGSCRFHWFWAHWCFRYLGFRSFCGFASNWLLHWFATFWLSGQSFRISAWWSFSSLFCFCLIVSASRLQVLIFVIETSRLNIHQQVSRQHQLILNVLRVVLMAVHPLSILDQDFNDFDRFLFSQNLDSLVVSLVLLQFSLTGAGKSHPNFGH